MTVYSLDVSSAGTGTKYRGIFKERAKGMIQPFNKTRHNLIIDEIHMIMGAGSVVQI